MNRFEIFEKLNEKPAGIFISKIEIASWGQELILSCLYDPDKNKHFEVHFYGCQEIHWEMIEDRSLQKEVVADVIDIILDAKRETQDAIIHTLEFEIIVTYGEVIVQKQWTD